MSIFVQVAAIGGGQREWEDREWFPPGPQLAICLSGGKERLADLTDDELLQVAAAARRQTSWAQARELAAIGELARRRTSDEDSDAEESGGPDYRVLSARESVTEEVAAALTVTGNSAATLVHLAEQLTGPLARTGDALGSGRIDMAKARVICDVTEHLPGDVAGRVQHAALEKAPEQTTGQLRRRIKRIAPGLAPTKRSKNGGAKRCGTPAGVVGHPVRHIRSLPVRPGNRGRPRHLQQDHRCGQRHQGGR